MTNLITIHNVETGEIIEREMNAAELAQYEKEQAEAQAEASALATKATQKAALLARMGLTEDEARLLLG